MIGDMSNMLQWENGLHCFNLGLDRGALWHGNNMQNLIHLLPYSAVNLISSIIISVCV